MTEKYKEEVLTRRSSDVVRESGGRRQRILSTIHPSLVHAAQRWIIIPSRTAVATQMIMEGKRAVPLMSILTRRREISPVGRMS